LLGDVPTIMAEAGNVLWRAERVGGWKIKGRTAISSRRSAFCGRLTAIRSQHSTQIKSRAFSPLSDLAPYQFIEVSS